MVVQLTPNSGNSRDYSSKCSPSEAANVSFRKLIPHADHPKIKGLRDSDALQWVELKRQSKEVGYMVDRLNAEHIEKPFLGFTSDGVVKEGVFKFAEDEGAPTEAIIKRFEKVENVLLLLKGEKGYRATLLKAGQCD